jgi:hypothetical protein
MVLVAILFALNAVCEAQGAKPLDNAQVISMTKADLGDAVIIAKIKASKEVRFNLETDDLLKLKAAGVSKAVIAAMIDRSAAKNSAASSGPSVMLSSKSGDVELKPVDGTLRQLVAPFVGLRRYIEFPPKAAATRISDRLPRLLVSADRDPSRTCFYVKIYHDGKSRWIDIEAPGNWGGSISNKPYGDCLQKFSVTEEKPGVWSFRTDSTLDPDDYGLYCYGGPNDAQQYVLYEFGIDK